jgi:hypothetical protein
MSTVNVISQTQVIDVTLPVQTVTVDPISSVVTVVSTAGSPIAVTNAGPVGPRGAGSGYTHTQLSAATVWTINHLLGYFPTAQAFTVGGIETLGEVQHITTNLLTVTFNTAIAGTARLS